MDNDNDNNNIGDCDIDNNIDDNVNDNNDYYARNDIGTSTTNANTTKI